MSRRDLTRDEIERASELRRLLGIAGGPSIGVRKWRGAKIGTGWQVEPGRLGDWRLAHALRGGIGLDVRGLREVGYITIDLDVHDVALDARSPIVGDDPGDWLAEPPRLPRALAATAHRLAIAKRVRRVVRSIRRAVPGVDLVVESSPRGLHLHVIFEKAHPVAEVRRIGLAILHAAGLDEMRDHVEVFPAVDADGSGRTCRVPMTARGRLLARDLVSLKHTRRARDVEELLSTPRVDLDVLVKLLHLDVGEAEKNTFSSSSPAPPEVQVRDKTREQARTHARKAAVEGQLFGAEFSHTVVSQARCIPRGGSYDFTRRFASMMVYAGIDDDEAVSLFRAVIEQRGHDANHCKTAAGRGQLVRTFRACLRRQQCGVERGEVRAGLLKNRRAWAMIESLRRGVEIDIAGDAKAPPGSWAETIAARKAAKAKAWATRRAREWGELPTVVEAFDAEVEVLTAEIEHTPPSNVLTDFLLEGIVARLVILERRRNRIRRGWRP